MATIQVRYLTSRPSGPGRPLRWFWQPSTDLQRDGWRPRRVPEDWVSYTDAGALHAAAIAAAQALNAQLDGARQNQRLAPPPMALPKRTLGELVKLYQIHDDYQRLADSTKRGYQQCIARLLLWGEDAPVRAIDAPRIQNLRQGLAGTPAVANAVVRVARLLLEFARRIGWVENNAATRPGLVGAAPSGLIWPAQAVLDFVAAADSMGRHSIGTAVLLNEWMGQREADILRMPKDAYRSGRLQIRQQKGARTTGAAVALPIDQVPHLKARLDAELGRHEARRRAAEAAGQPVPLATSIIVSEATGQPYKADHFRHSFAAVRATLGGKCYSVDYLLPGRDMTDADAFVVRAAELTFMHLRHTAITRLGELGLSSTLISSVSGHSLSSVDQILKRYMVRTAAMARVAFQARVDAEGVVTMDDQKDEVT